MGQNITTYGLIGYPLGHSLSPLMHNAAFKALGVEATYELFPLKPDELDNFFSDLKQKDSPIFGLNVTVPYKEKVIPYLDNLNPYAKKVAAVNTIVISENRKLSGYNTDGPGFLAHMTELGFQPQGKRIAILGAGGATRAVLSALCMSAQRPEAITIYDVEPEKAQSLVKDLSVNFNCGITKAVDSLDDLNVELADLLVNATPVGMKPSDIPLIDEEMLHANMLVYDLIYNPAQTALLEMAQRKGAQAANGLGMLYYQGVLAFQHWANVELPENIKKKMRDALDKGLQQRIK